MGTSYERMPIEDLRKMSKKNLLQQADGINSDLVEKVFSERGLNLYEELEKADRFLLDDIDEEFVHNLGFKGINIPISKELYKIYCKNCGFMSEDDIGFILRKIYNTSSHLLAEKIERTGVERLAGKFNLVLLEYLKMMGYTDRFELSENEYGYGLMAKSDPTYYLIAREYDEYKNKPDVPQQIKNIIEKWKERFRSVPEYDPFLIISDMYIHISSKEFDITLRPFDFEATYSQFRNNQKDIVKDIESTGLKARYYEDVRF